MIDRHIAMQASLSPFIFLSIRMDIREHIPIMVAISDKNIAEVPSKNAMPKSEVVDNKEIAIKTKNNTKPKIVIPNDIFARKLVWALLFALKLFVSSLIPFSFFFTKMSYKQIQES